MLSTSPSGSSAAACACCVTWKHADVDAMRLARQAQHRAVLGAGGEPRLGVADARLGNLCAQVSLGVPRPLLAVAPAPAAAGDGGVLIQTVRGVVSTAELGWTSSHEHIFANDAKSTIVARAYPETFPREYIISEGTAALRRFKAAGGGSMIDCTTVDLGRDVGLMQEVSAAADVNIVATTGCWID
jgi:hypothetical protein